MITHKIRFVNRFAEFLRFIFGGEILRIELERILSLLPKKEDGDFVRGAKKEFAESIGYDSGDIVSMWLNGSSESYLKKLHEISAKYNVSVEWLKGETDDQTPAWQKESPPQGGEPIHPEWYGELTPDEREQVRRYAEFLIAERQKDQP